MSGSKTTMLSLASGGSQCSRLTLAPPALAGAAAGFSAAFEASAGGVAAGPCAWAPACGDGAVVGAAAAALSPGFSAGLGASTGLAGAGVLVGAGAGAQAARIGSVAAAPSPIRAPRRNDRRDRTGPGIGLLLLPSSLEAPSQRHDPVAQQPDVVGPGLGEQPPRQLLGPR